MKPSLFIMKMIIGLCLIAGFARVLMAADIREDLDKRDAADLGKVKITALSAYAWRDWMPIVAQPGPDRGAPLNIKAKLMVNNSSTSFIHLTYKAMIIDDKGKSYAATFHTLPNFRVIPDAVAKVSSKLDHKGYEALLVQYNVYWDGSLKPGEGREIEIMTNDGPYLPEGEFIRVGVSWYDLKGNFVTVVTPGAILKRIE